MSRIRTAAVRAVSVACLAVGIQALASAQVCTFVNGADVIVGDLTGPANYAAAGGLEALSLGTTSCNLGDAELEWFANTNRHPAIGGTLYRYKDMGGWFAFEQAGQSWLKHGFLALDLNLCCSNCQDTDGSHLGIGCSDPYSASRNGGQGNLGPKWQVDASKGLFTYPPADPGFSGSTARRLEVEITDLEPSAGSSTRFFGESHYVTPDDAEAGNQNNNASYRELSVSGSGTTWNFGFIGGTQRERSAIRAWQDVDPSVSEVELQLDGLLVLAHQVTDLGGGQWHYEYALYNMNSHESLRSFSIPVQVGVNVTNVGFHDVAYRNGDGEGHVDRDGADWPAMVAGGSLTWQTDTFASDPNANALRWGTTYNFRFDADVPPTSGSSTWISYRANQALDVPGVLVPSAPAVGSSFCDASDGALALCPCANAGDPDSGCDIAQGTGGVRAQASAFAPDGLGGGSGVFQGSGFPAGGGFHPAVVLMRGTAHEATPVAFGDGLRCVSSTGLVRIQSGLASSGSVSLAFSHGAGAGTFAYQLWFRNTPGGYCTASAFNLSNGVDLTW